MKRRQRCTLSTKHLELQANVYSGHEKASDEALLLQILGTALAPASVVVGAAAPEYTLPLHIVQVVGEGQYLHNESVRLLKESEALIREYEELNEPTTSDSLVDPAIEKFNHEYRSTEAIFAAGRKVSKLAIENMLADKCHEVRGGTQITKEEKERAEMLLPVDRQGDCSIMEGYEGWGEIAHKSHRAAEKMVVDRNVVEA